MLNESLVPSPYEYFAAKGAARSSNFCKGERTAWDARTVLRILSNETYAGTLVQGKTCKPDFRRKAVLLVDESEWDRSPGAHEAIVDPATFGLVRKLARRDMRCRGSSSARIAARRWRGMRAAAPAANASTIPARRIGRTVPSAACTRCGRTSFRRR